MTIQENARIPDVRDLARQHTPAAIAVLIEIACDDNAPMAPRVKAASTLRRHRGLVDNFDELQRSGNWPR